MLVVMKWVLPFVACGSLDVARVVILENAPEALRPRKSECTHPVVVGLWLCIRVGAVVGRQRGRWVALSQI